jgi:hypothetical protein
MAGRKSVHFEYRFKPNVGWAVERHTDDGDVDGVGPADYYDSQQEARAVIEREAAKWRAKGYDVTTSRGRDVSPV